MNYDDFFSQAGHSMRHSAIRQMSAVLAQATDMVSFAPGYPAEDAFPWQAFREIAMELLDGTDGSVLQYGPTRGYRPLRDAIASVMAERGIRTSLDQIVVTTGSQQGLDLVARVLVDPGDDVLVELPSYTGAIMAFRNVGASLVGVPQTDDGIDLDELDATLSRLRSERRRVKFVYVVPNFQNPTGLLMSQSKRHGLLDWAQRRNVLIVEDDPYRDLYFEDVTQADETRALAADDKEGRVVYLSSFSKTLAPGLRVAWMSAAEPIANKLELAKQAEDLCAGVLDQRIVYEAYRRGVLSRQLPLLRAHYQHKRNVMSAALSKLLADALTWATPRGGFFLWPRLVVPGLSSDTLLPLAQARGVIYMSGTAFYVNGGGDQYLRLSFSAPPPERIEEGVARLAAAVNDARAAAGAPSDRPAYQARP